MVVLAGVCPTCPVSIKIAAVVHFLIEFVKKRTFLYKIFSLLREISLAVLRTFR